MLRASKYAPLLRVTNPLKNEFYNRTVMSPYAGGPVYQYMRSGWQDTRLVFRHINRWIEYNWEPESHTQAGNPEQSLEPSENIWRYYVDTCYYHGVQDKIREDFDRFFLMPFIFFPTYLAMSLWRYRQNDKFNTYAKWANTD